MAYYQKINTKIKCQKSIAPSELKDTHTYMNTYKLPTKHAFKSPYYEKGRVKLMLEHGQDSRERNALDKYALVEEINEFIQHDKIGQSHKYFKTITTKPIITNKVHHLLEEDYPLQQEEVLNVCSSKIFEIKNYYNYLYQKEAQQTMERIERRNENLENIYKLQPTVHEELDMSQMAISKTHQRQEESVFDPKHSKYLNPTETLHPKEKYRMEEVLRNSHKYGDA